MHLHFLSTNSTDQTAFPYALLLNLPHLRRIFVGKRPKSSDIVRIDGAASGWAAGAAAVIAFTRPPNHPDTLGTSWNKTIWSYHGQGSAGNFPDSHYGSAICRADDGNFVPFFRYVARNQVMADWVQSVACDSLVDQSMWSHRGCELVARCSNNLGAKMVTTLGGL